MPIPFFDFLNDAAHVGQPSMNGYEYWLKSASSIDGKPVNVEEIDKYLNGLREKGILHDDKSDAVIAEHEKKIAFRNSSTSSSSVSYDTCDIENSPITAQTNYDKEQQSQEGSYFSFYRAGQIGICCADRVEDPFSMLFGAIVLFIGVLYGLMFVVSKFRNSNSKSHKTGKSTSLKNKEIEEKEANEEIKDECDNIDDEIHSLLTPRDEEEVLEIYEDEEEFPQNGLEGEHRASFEENLQSSGKSNLGNNMTMGMLEDSGHVNFDMSNVKEETSKGLSISGSADANLELMKNSRFSQFVRQADSVGVNTRTGSLVIKSATSQVGAGGLQSNNLDVNMKSSDDDESPLCQLRASRDRVSGLVTQMETKPNTVNANVSNNPPRINVKPPAASAKPAKLKKQKTKGQVAKSKAQQAHGFGAMVLMDESKINRISAMNANGDLVSPSTKKANASNFHEAEWEEYNGNLNDNISKSKGFGIFKSTGLSSSNRKNSLPVSSKQTVRRVITNSRDPRNQRDPRYQRRQTLTRQPSEKESDNWNRIICGSMILFLCMGLCMICGFCENVFSNDPSKHGGNCCQTVFTLACGRPWSGPWDKDNLVPIQVKGDGSCMFHSIVVNLNYMQKKFLQIGRFDELWPPGRPIDINAEQLRSDIIDYEVDYWYRRPGWGQRSFSELNYSEQISMPNQITSNDGRPRPDLSDPQDFSRYMKKPTSWGGYMELVGFRDLYSTMRVRVFHRMDRTRDFMLVEHTELDRNYAGYTDKITYDLTTVNLIHDVNHYWGLVPHGSSSMAYGNGEGACPNCF